MTACSGPTDYRRCCLMLMIMASYYHVATSITVIDHFSKEQDGEDGKDTTNDDAHLEKVEDEDAENKHFMDTYSLQSGPQQLEFGHVFEDPNVWEQRYEKKDFDANRYQGKVKWGDKDGGYGEQYWDLNHGGAGDSAHDNEEYGRQEEPASVDYGGQETRKRTVIYKPMVITFVKNKPKKPPPSVRITRHNSKRLEPTVAAAAIAPVNPGKKNAPVLVFDMKTGIVMDEATGNKFVLKSIDDQMII